MGKNAQTPSLRFTGFTAPWEQQKLSSIVDRVTRKNTDLQSLLPLTISAQYGLVDQITYFNNRVASQNISNYYLIKNGEFAYNKSSSDGYPFGTVKRLDLYNMGVLSTLYIIFAIKDQNVNSDFLVCYYDTDKWHKQISERAAEGARNHGLLNISTEEFLDTTLMIPSDIEEQYLIGTYLKELDNLITLQQHKIEKLINVKKSMLENMFPQENESVPKIRFSGFTAPWEQHKVQDVFKITRGYVLAAPETSEALSDEMPYPVYSSQTKNNGLMGYYKDYLYENAITWTTDGANAGTVNYRSGKFYCTNVCGVLLSDEGYANKCVAEALNNVAWKWVSHVGNPKLMNNVMGEIPITLPISIEEQNQISDFFEQIDTLITLHQQKLEKLKNIKKSMLEKMFV